MNRNSLKTTLIILLISCLYSVAVTFRSNTLVNAHPSILIVGPNEIFKSIQEAINNASPGDTVLVRSWIYKEKIVINKSIILIGENRENTIIDGGGLGNVISIIQSSDVTIRGFTIKNSDPIVGCGIYIENSKNITIDYNNVELNYVGVQVIFSSQNQIFGNTISLNYVGIQLISSGGNTIHGNMIRNNSYGINFFVSIGNMVHENIISGNYRGAYIYLNSYNNVFYHNNFITNRYNVYAERANIWSVGGEGNYWDDYIGKDLNKDGVGDSPYNITSENVDYYPLMGMFYKFTVFCNGKFHDVAIISNSTVFNFTFKIQAETKARIILFNVSSSIYSACFSRIAVPKALMKSIHAVLVNDYEVNATLLNIEDSANIRLYVEHSGACSVKIVYSELLDQYYELLESVNMLIEKLDMLNTTLDNLLEDYDELQSKFNDIGSLYQNFRSLIYIFAATTTIFVLTTIYFSKKTHEKAVKARLQRETD